MRRTNAPKSVGKPKIIVIRQSFQFSNSGLNDIDDVFGLGDLDGIFGKIGKAFKKIGKVAAPIAAGFIPVVGGVASDGVSALLNRGGGNDKMAKKCAKKASAKGCNEYFAQIRQAEAAQAEAQREKDLQKEIQLKTLQALQNSQNNSGGGINTTTLLLIGGGVGALFLILMMMRG